MANNPNIDKSAAPPKKASKKKGAKKR